MTAVINALAAGSNSIVTAVSGKAILVTGFNIRGNTTMTMVFADGAGGASLSGDVLAASGTGPSMGYHPSGYFQTSRGNALGLTVTGAGTVRGFVTYRLV